MTNQKQVSLSPDTLTERDNYKFLTGSIIPRPVALVTTISPDGVVNAAPFSYFNIVTANPPIISLAIQRKEGVMKDTARNLVTEGSAVIHIVDEDNVTEANKTAANRPADESELLSTTLTTTPSEKIAAPGLKESKVRMETKLLERVPIENEGIITADLFLLHIQHYHIANDIYQDGRIDPDKLAAISRLAGSDYAKIGQRFSLTRPE